MPRRSRKRKKKQQGGMLRGPSHEQGGIPAVVGGNTPVELEGGEYIVNAQTVDAVGTQFLDQLNSTQTSYHTGGFNQGQLPGPSNYKKGGKIRRNKMRRGGRPRKRMQYGGISPTGANTMPFGTATTTCPPGTHIMPDGTCMQGTTHPGGNYRKGGKTNGRNKMRYRKGGRPVARKAMRRGGRPVARKTTMRKGGRPRTRMQAGGGIGNCPQGNYGVDQYGNTKCV